METEFLVPNENDSFSRIEINGERFLLRFTYNDTFDFWTFGIYDMNQAAIIAGLKIVPNFPLNIFQHNRHLDGVFFIAESKNETIGHNDFRNENARFIMVVGA
jgi:hypothetical protein